MPDAPLLTDAVPPPPHRTPPWLAVGLVALAAASYGYAVACIPDPTRFTQDEANYAAEAWALWDHGAWPTYGPAVHGSAFSLGVAFPVLEAVAAGLTGSLHGAIRAMLLLHAAAVLVWGLGSAPLLGARRAWLVAVLVAASPWFYAGLTIPLVHQPYGQVFGALAMVGAWRLAAGGGRGAWAVATLGAALAMHFHLTWWPVAFVVLDAVWQRRASLPWHALPATGLTLLALNHEVLGLLRPDTLTELSGTLSAQGVTGPRDWHTFTALSDGVTRATPGGAWTVGLAIACGVAAIATWRRDPVRAVVARASFVHAAAGLALWWVNANAWSHYYNFGFLPSATGLLWVLLDLLSDLLGARVPAARGLVAAAATVGGIAFLPHGLRHDFSPATVAAMNDLGALEALDTQLRHRAGRDDLTGPAPRVHGLLCASGTLQPCRFDVWSQRWPQAAVSPGPLRVRFDGRTPQVERFDDCLTRDGDGWTARCDTPVVLHVVADLPGPSRDRGPDEVQPDMLRLTLDGVPVPTQLMPGLPTGAHNTVFVFTTPAAVWSGRLELDLAPDRATVLDVFPAPQSYDLAAFGLDATVP